MMVGSMVSMSVSVTVTRVSRVSRVTMSAAVVESVSVPGRRSVHHLRRWSTFASPSLSGRWSWSSRS
jgi:hypothetical protein